MIAAVDHAVLDVLGDVGGADEQHLDGGVAARKCQRTLTGLLRAKAGVLEQLERRLTQPALDGQRDFQELRTPLLRSSASL